MEDDRPRSVTEERQHSGRSLTAVDAFPPPRIALPPLSTKPVLPSFDSPPKDPTSGKPVDDVVTPIAKSLASLRPSTLNIPPRRGKVHQPVGYRTVKEAPMDKMGELDVASRVVLSPKSKARAEKQKALKEEALETAGRTASSKSLGGLKPGAVSPSGHPDVVETLLLQVSGALSCCVGVFGAGVATLTRDSSTSDACTGILGVVLVVAGGLALRTAGSRNQVLEASEQQRQWRRGQCELLTYALLSGWVFLAHLYNVYAGMSENDRPLEERCERRILSAITRLLMGCDASSTLELRTALTVLSLIAACFSFAIGVRGYRFQHQHEALMLEMRMNLAMTGAAAPSTPSSFAGGGGRRGSTTELQVRTMAMMRHRLDTKVATLSKQLTYLSMFQVVGAAVVLFFGRPVEVEATLIVLILAISEVSSLLCLLAARVHNLHLVHAASVLQFLSMALLTNLVMLMFQAHEAQDSECGDRAYCNGDVFHKADYVKLAIFSVVLWFTKLVACYYGFRLHANIHYLRQVAKDRMWSGAPPTLAQVGVANSPVV